MNPIIYDRVQEIMFNALRELETRILIGTEIRVLNFHLNSTLEDTGHIVSRFIYGFNPTIRKQYIKHALNHFNFSDSKGRMEKPYHAYNVEDIPLRTLSNKDYHERPFYYCDINPLQPQALAPDQEPEKGDRKGRQYRVKLPITDESPAPPFAFSMHDSSNDRTEKMLRFFHHCLEQHCPYVRSFMRVTQPHINPTTYGQSKKKLYNSIILTFSSPLDETYQQVVAKKTRDFIVQYLIDYHVQSALEGYEHWQKIRPVEAPANPVSPERLLHKKPMFEGTDRSSNIIKNQLYQKLMHQEPEQADQVYEGLTKCIEDLQRHGIWNSPLNASLERVKTIHDEVVAHRMDITRFMDNIRARLFTLAMHLVFDWTIYSVNCLLVKSFDLSVAKNPKGRAVPGMLKEFNRFVFIHGLKNDQMIDKLKKAKNDHRYTSHIVRYLAHEECSILKELIKTYHLEQDKHYLLQALNGRLGVKN